jgi:hypothetical protein
MSKIADIQRDYIGLLESYLDPLGKDALSDHIKSGNRYASLPYISDVLLAYYESLPQDIADFWKSHARELKQEIASQETLKLCYSGDLSPSNASALVNKLGLYVDTMLIPDPVFNITQQLNEISQRKFYLRSLIRHSLNIIKLKPLLEANLDSPIALIYPSTKIYDPVFREEIRKEAMKNTVRYLNQTFEIGLKEGDDPFEAMSAFKRPENLVKALKKPGNLIPDLTNPSIPEGFKDFYEDSKRMYVKRFANVPAGYGLCGYVFGRLMSFHDNFANCKEFAAEPIYDSPNSWKMFTWFLNDVFPHGNVLTNEGLVANSIGVNNPHWIGKLPDEKLVEARVNGDLHEIRSVLTSGINRMKYSPSKDLEKVTSKVQENLKEAFNEHQQRLKQIEKTLRRKYFLDYPLAVGGSLLGYIPHPVTIAASVPFTLAGWAGLYRDSKKIKASKSEGRIIGMMYDSKE